MKLDALSAGPLLERSMKLMLSAAKGAMDSVRNAWYSHAVSVVSSGVSAHFRISGIRPGAYFLAAEWSLASDRHDWVVPISINRGANLLLDLDNSNVTAPDARVLLYCPNPPIEPTAATSPG